MEKYNIYAKKIIQNPKSKSSIKKLQSVKVPAFLEKCGPDNVVQVYDPQLKMQGFLVIDNNCISLKKTAFCLGMNKNKQLEGHGDN